MANFTNRQLVDRDLSVLTIINAERGSLLGIGALVPGPGAVSIGDRLASAEPA